MEPAALGDRVGRRDRRRDGVHPAQRDRPLLDALRRHCEAGRPLRVLTTTYTGSTERRALDQLVDLGADVRISYDLEHDPAARQGVGVPSAVRVLDGVRRLVEPHALGPGHRTRVERARVRGPQPRRARQVRRRVRQLLGGRRLRPVRPDEFDDEQHRAGRNRSRPACDPQPDRAAAVPVPGTAARADRAVAPARPSPQPARRRDRHRQDRHGGPRLRPASASSSTALDCCSSPTARRSSTRAWPRSATRCATRRSARSGSAARARRGSSTSSRRSRACTPATSPRCRPTTSTW